MALGSNSFKDSDALKSSDPMDTEENPKQNICSKRTIDLGPDIERRLHTIAKSHVPKESSCELQQSLLENNIGEVNLNDNEEKSNELQKALDCETYEDNVSYDFISVNTTNLFKQVASLPDW